MQLKGKGVGGLFLGVVLVVVALALVFLVVNASSIVRTVPDQTNDEMEVAPS